MNKKNGVSSDAVFILKNFHQCSQAKIDVRFPIIRARQIPSLLFFFFPS